ncbi:Uncharacterised protein [Mycobacteroides abscessus]|uniref:hypothetical protein n=1 Tax=Mycobacteriaceae TaxID=1762 RepID=UPI0002DDB3C8|nr:hypothetical protein [Mycobacteroides abscessus]CPT79052.1 Uncharacterised protein [Mycobacteroides abscessus]CPU62779.1 Uncharacterised protein [Mycobacteroides abscessus]SKQ36560.1 Uncharacterised protein [Mycobacteroides abscessus subsp. massiliense]SKW96715.1 Uncharacterised protein [Mycobacteroides abscessus subsp. massiliense]
MNEYERRAQDQKHHLTTSLHNLWVREILGRALEAARGGRLTLNWREQLTSPAGCPPDVAMLALEEVRQTPVAAWEPAARADWEEALGSWFANTRELLVQDYIQKAAQQHRALETRSTLFLHPHVFHDGRLADMVRKEDSASDIAIDSLIRQQSNLYIAARDRACASYLAGLAAGGQPNDWVGWFSQRIDTWDSPEIAKSNRMQLDWISRNWEQLPLYWTY